MGRDTHFKDEIAYMAVIVEIIKAYWVSPSVPFTPQNNELLSGSILFCAVSDSRVIV